MTEDPLATHERIRALRPAAWLCEPVGILLLANGWYWHFSLAGLILCAAGVGMFLGKTFALHAALWSGRACLLLLVPFQMVTSLRLHVWDSPPAWLQIWLRTEALPVVLLLGAMILLEVTRHRLRQPLSPWWSSAAMAVGVLATGGWRILPAMHARRHVDPVAWEQAWQIIRAVEEEPLLFRRPEWWNDAPWNELRKTPAWQRPVMRCSCFSLRGSGQGIGDWGIGPWFGHPKARQAPGVVDYRFRDGSRWRGTEVSRYLTTRSGERMQLKMELRISHSPPDPNAAPPKGPAPDLYPES
jgi:hypothetical protein